MQKTVKKNLFKLLDADSAEHVVDEHSFINGENIRFGPSLNGGFGYFESVPGNESLSNQVLKPAGTNTAIGGCIDESRRRIIKFNYNSNGDHGIYIYDIPNATEYKMLLNSQVTGGLNFAKNNLIHSAEVVGDLLFWTDNINEPRVINIEAGIKLNHAGYSTSIIPYTTPLVQDDINMIKRPAIYPPTFVKKTNVAFTLNFVAESALKFMWRYSYRDFQYSVISHWSKLATFNTAADTYNYIEVSMDTQESIPQTVQKVELILLDATTNVAKIIKTWDKSIVVDATEISNHNLGATPLTLNFYNNRGGVALSAAELSTIEHAVPKRCLTLCAGRKRMFLGNLKVGSNGPIQSSLTFSLVDGSTSSTLTGIVVKRFETVYRNLSTMVLTYSSSYWVNLTSVPNPGWYYINGSEATNGGPTFPLLGSPSSPIDFVTGLTFVGDREIDVIHHLEPANNVMQSYTLYTTAHTVTVNNAPTDNSGSFKANSPYQGGIFFYDASKRRIGMFTDSSMIFNIPDRDYGFSAYKRAVGWTLSNLSAASQIPADACYYSIGRTQNLRTRYFVQGHDDEPRYAIKADDGTYTVDTVAGSSTGKEYLAVNLNNLKKDGLGYVLSEGDLIRIYDSGGSVIVTLPIVAQTGKYIITKFYDFGTLTGSSKMLYEIYTPYKPGDQEFFYEVGNMFPITNAGSGSREFSILSGTLTGDAYLLSRTSIAGTSYQAEAMSNNDKYWSRWYTDIGFPFPNVRGKETDKPYSFRWTDTYIIGSEANGNCAIDTLNEQTLSVENGQIHKFILADKIDDQGTVLVAICRSNTNSIYIGEAQITDATGANIFFSKTEQVVNNINPLKGGRGTINPESVYRDKNGLIFFYDLYNGKFVQYASNGLQDISDFGIERFTKLFSDKYRLVATATIEGYGYRPFVFGCVDPFSKEYIVAIPQVANSSPKGMLSDLDTPMEFPYDIFDGKGKVLAYKYHSNAWAAPYKFAPDWMISVEDKLYTFYGNNIYQHNVTSVPHNSFYGVQTKSRLMLLVNEESSQIKEFLSLQIESNIKPSFIHIRTEQPNIQSSDVMSSDTEWKNREGVFMVEIFKDRLSPNVTGDANLKLKIGDRMRGNWAKILLEFDVATDGELRFRFLNICYKTSLGFARINP